jgi:hypothetical protein
LCVFTTSCFGIILTFYVWSQPVAVLFCWCAGTRLPVNGLFCCGYFAAFCSMLQVQLNKNVQPGSTAGSTWGYTWFHRADSLNTSSGGSFPFKCFSATLGISSWYPKHAVCPTSKGNHVSCVHFTALLLRPHIIFGLFLLFGALCRFLVVAPFWSISMPSVRDIFKSTVPSVCDILESVMPSV